MMARRHCRLFPTVEMIQHTVTAQTRSSGRDWLLIAGFALSGFTALGLELVWIKTLGLAFGAERFGVLAVLSGFFAGMTVGAVMVQRYLRRARDPVLIYVACEGVIAVYALASPHLLVWLSGWLPLVLEPAVGDNQSTGALLLNTVVSMLVLLPATSAMGATTAALVEGWRRRVDVAARHLTVGRLYAGNTLGAVAGVAVVTYLLIPALGLAGSAYVCLASSLAALAAIMFWNRSNTPADTTPAPAAASASTPSRALLPVLFLTGFCAIGLEYLAIQVLGQVLEDTVYTFANLLGVYLVGTALGAWLYTSPPVQRLGTAETKTRYLLLGLGMAVIASGVVMANGHGLVAALVPPGSGYGRYLAGDLLAAALVFAAPTVLMGMLFSHLVGQFANSGVGAAYAVNTLGGTLAPILISVGTLPLFGLTTTLYLLVALYLGLFAWLSRARRGTWLITGMTAVVALFAIDSLVLVRLPTGFSLAAQSVGVHGVVSVGETMLAPGPTGTGNLRLLQVNQNFLMGGAHGYVERRMGHLPLLLAERRSDVLYLGVGTGITAGAATGYPDVARVTAVELVPEIVDLLPWFAAQNAAFYEDPRVQLRTFDARRFARVTRDTYDVIVADLFHPSRDGAGSLFTAEHFRAIEARLRAPGTFVQWLPVYQLRPAEARLVIRTFLAVFNDVDAVVANFDGQAALGLVARKHAAGDPGVRLERDMVAVRTGFANAREVLATYLMDRPTLANFAGSGPLNTDLNQRMVHDAARAIATDDPMAPYAVLGEMLPLRRPVPDRWLGQPGAVVTEARLRSDAAFAYMAADIELHRSPDPTRTLHAARLMVDAYQAGHEPALRTLLQTAVKHGDQAREVIAMLAAGDVAGRHGPWLRQALTSPEDAQLIDAVRSYVSRL